MYKRTPYMENWFHVFRYNDSRKFRIYIKGDFPCLLVEKAGAQRECKRSVEKEVRDHGVGIEVQA